MKTTSLIILLFYLLVTSCNKEKKDVDRSIVMEQYKRDAIINGNEYAFGSYLEYTDNNSLYLEKLSLSIIMNRKHKCSLSYYQIFRSMIELNCNNEYKVKYLNKLNDIDKQFALHYLVEGAKRNIITCQMTLESLYRNGYGIEKNEKKSDSLYFILEDRSIGRFYKENRSNKSKIDRFVDY